MKMVRPPRLRVGASVAVVAPGGPLSPEQLRPGLEILESWQLRPIVMPHVHQSWGYLAGSDDERLGDLISAWEDRTVSAIISARGGYGSMRIVDRFDYGLAARHPKAFVGFSDITAFHLALLKRARLVTFYGPMVGMDKELWAVEREHQTLRKLLLGEAGPGPLPSIPKSEPPLTVVPGVAEGVLIGGNLSMITASLGSPDQPNTEGALLVVDEWGEVPYRIDRMFTQLARAGLLQRISGLILGDIFSTRDGVRARRQIEAELVQDQIRVIGVPTILGFPVGHSQSMTTFPLGVRSRLDASSCTVELLEPATV
jgi:muramoyltetrapeptide carboxypeptidase